MAPCRLCVAPTSYCGYEVDHVCNLTDIDDKIIKRMTRDGVTLRQLTDKYAQVRQPQPSLHYTWGRQLAPAARVDSRCSRA